MDLNAFALIVVETYFPQSSAEGLGHLTTPFPAIRERVRTWDNTDCRTVAFGGYNIRQL
jgi:hypothetical protein